MWIGCFYFGFPPKADQVPPWVNDLSAQLDLINERLTSMSKELDDLTAQVKANSDLLDSATTLINGIAARIDAAVAAAGAAGATPAELAQMVALSAELKAKDDSLSAAVVANTPAA